jgi:hypothetical protein
MNYLAININIGTPDLKRVMNSRIKFHDAVASILFPKERKNIRLGLDIPSTITNYDYVHNPASIDKILEEALKHINDAINLCIIDFTDDMNLSIRDPLLIALFESIRNLCVVGACTYFAVLLPELPGDVSASYVFLDTFSRTMLGDCTVVLIANSGKNHQFSLKKKRMPAILDSYKKAVIDLYGLPTARLERKCIRRLGHFRSEYYWIGQHKCRRFSYFIRDCQDELLVLFEEWWARNTSNTHSILFDLANNEPFRKSIKAFGEKMSIQTFRIQDIFTKPELKKKIKKTESCVLVLDVVDEGETLSHYIGKLDEIGINVNKKVVAAINKTGSKQSKSGEYNIHGLLARQSEHIAEPCIQCSLGLPYEKDSHESFIRIRTFDMLDMSRNSGWSPEFLVEVPNGRQQYQMIPNFDKMLEEYGDWIGYKIRLLLQNHNCPESWFILHPDEAQSTVLVKKIQTVYDWSIPVVHVPRDLITEAQKNNDRWDKTLVSNPSNSITKELAALTNSSSLIVDIFWGSGSSCRSLLALLKHFRIGAFAYVSFVDFEPQKQDSVDGLPKYSLYQWYNPRTSDAGRVTYGRA